MAAYEIYQRDAARARPGRSFPDTDAIAMLWQRDPVRFARERTQLYGSIARTVVSLCILGAGLRGSVTVSGRVSYLAFVFPGMMAMAILFSSLQSAIGVIFDRGFGFLKEVPVAPIPRSSIIAGKALAGATVSTVLGSLVFLFAPIAGAALQPLAWRSAVRLLFAARMTSFEGFGTINNFVTLPLYFLSAAQFPLGYAPSWIKLLAALNPLAYAVDLLRGLLDGIWSYHAAPNLSVIVAFALATLSAATFAFARQE